MPPPGRRSGPAPPSAGPPSRHAAPRSGSRRGRSSPGFWRSPLRGRWLTSLLGLVLLVGLPVIAITGLLSYAAYNPRLHGNDQTPGATLLKFFLFSWPTHPAWLYRVDQGVHVTLGLALLPVVLAKLWSVLPNLFSWPPVRSPAHALERLSLVMVVGGVLFEFGTGILNIQDFYVFPFSFYTAHLYGAWVFIAGLVVHVALKFPKMMAGLRSRSLRRELRTPLAATQPEAPDPEGLRAADPAPPTVSRRGMLVAVGGASLALAALTVGQSIGGWTRRTALFAPRGLSAVAPGALPVNHTAVAARITAADTGPAYRLVVTGRRTAMSLTSAPAHGAAAAHRRAAARVRRGLVLLGRLDRRAAGGAGPAGRDDAAGRRPGGVVAAGGPVPQRHPVGRPGERPPVHARVVPQRRGPAARPRLSGPDDHPGRARRAQHQVG